MLSMGEACEIDRPWKKVPPSRAGGGLCTRERVQHRYLRGCNTGSDFSSHQGAWLDSA